MKNVYRELLAGNRGYAAGRETWLGGFDWIACVRARKKTLDLSLAKT